MKKILLILFFLLFFNKALSEDKMLLGLEIYNNKAHCGVCHTLQAAGSDGQIATNLYLLKPQINQIILAVTNGISVMPAYEGTLTEKEIEAVAYYIYKSTNK